MFMPLEKYPGGHLSLAVLQTKGQPKTRHTNSCFFSCLKMICCQSHNCHVTGDHLKIIRKLSNIRFDSLNHQTIETFQQH
jgi:hypothetical protein